MRLRWQLIRDLRGWHPRSWLEILELSQCVFGLSNERSHVAQLQLADSNSPPLRTCLCLSPPYVQWWQSSSWLKEASFEHQTLQSKCDCADETPFVKSRSIERWWHMAIYISMLGHASCSGGQVCSLAWGRLCSAPVSGVDY